MTHTIVSVDSATGTIIDRDANGKVEVLLVGRDAGYVGRHQRHECGGWMCSGIIGCADAGTNLSTGERSGVSPAGLVLAQREMVNSILTR